MTEKKLTPRVGDRVLTKKGQYFDYTRIGTVDRIDRDGDYWVSVDGTETEWCYPPNLLTVVDRSPVEWPEGWGERTSVRPHAFLIRDGDYRVAISPELFDRIRGPEGDYVAEHLDELLGGDS